MPPRKPKEKPEPVAPTPVILPSEPVTAMRRERRATPTTLVMGILSLCAFGCAGYFYYQYTHTREVMEAKEISALTQKIGSVMELPANETPTLATVTNKEKLDNQTFFKKAENGDKILIYADAGQAILYRPSTEKIIDMTSVTITDNQTTPEAQPIPAPPTEPESAQETPPTETAVPETDPLTVPATVALYNGSKKVGVTNTVEGTLMVAFENVSVTMKEKAAKNDYAKHLVIDLSGNKLALAEAVAEHMGGTVVPALPAGETAPTDADILIIIGNQ